MAKVIVEMSGDEQKLWAALQKVATQQDHVANKFRNVGQQGKKAGKDAEDAFGDRAIAGLKSYVAGIASIAAAYNVARQALADLEAERQAAADRTKASAMGMSSLAQLSGGSSQKMLSLTQAAREMYRAGGASDLDQAARTVFALESAGALQHRELFAQLYGILEKPDVMAKAATTLVTSMGEEETGGLPAVLGKAFAASSFSPTSADALLEAAARSGGAARMLGVSDEEVLGGVARLATATGSAERGGTQLAAFLQTLAKKGDYAGLSLEESVAKIGTLTGAGGAPMSPAELIEYFGREEAFSAYANLRNEMPKVREAVAAQQAAGPDYVQRIIEAQLAQPELAGWKGEQISKAKFETSPAQRLAAVDKLMRDEITQRKLTEYQEEHGVGVGSWLYGKHLQLAGKFGGFRFDPSSVEVLGLRSGTEMLMDEYGTPEERKRWHNMRGDAKFDDASPSQREIAEEHARYLADIARKMPRNTTLGRPDVEAPAAARGQRQ